MRDFNDKDRTRKRERIQLPENPANLTEETLLQLEEAVQAGLRDGYLPCPAAWRIARDFNVPRIAVGAVLDRLGRRVTDCQLGCFKVDKTPYDGSQPEKNHDDVVAEVSSLCQQDRLTCEAAFEIARRLKVRPMDVADAANVNGCKIRQCQLGCF